MNLRVHTHCPDCGTPLTEEPWARGACLSCLVQLALAPPCEEETLDREEQDAATLDSAGSRLYTGGPTFTPGQLLGERYRIESLLGRGGMGEVWRAYDLKLRLEVALKSLHPKLFDTPIGLEMLRDEVRAAREVISPNVCRLFDLVEVDGRELVSMEYIDGVTLLEHLNRSRPLELKEANEIASQLLAGLEAIHQAGLVHRDIKPENVMLTRTHRVVIMDFGLTSPSGEGSMGGTPAYMPPEQARGEPVDARADVFSAGMVLAEMLSAEAGPEQSSRQTFWKAVREQPPQIPESPWRAICERALSVEVEERYESAEALGRALEEVAFRVEGAEHEDPYPGLASFQEEDAEFFFGREVEVEALWKKLGQAHLLGLIGPSGSGKSSFVNAGLLPARPEGWSCVRMTPRRAPFAALGRALLPELEGDAEGMESLVALEDPASAQAAFRAWREKHEQVLLIVDQFEELFTQSSEDVQRRFAELLGRAALDADTHVLLSMRDDFLLQCHGYDALEPLFSELTPLKAPTGSALRRALVQPALRCGYRYDEEAVVEAMLEEVTRERGALPLIAFTAAQLWEKRDEETGYLTASAYQEMGGVGGALAQHADATVEAIGEERIPVVRELFRNLVTARGTRATRDREELLSVFDSPVNPEREAAKEVLDALIGARLLTSYETPAENDRDTEHHRIEIIHESLLAAWPRLVRWQDQDRAGAQLRDELRHQAELWQQHDRSTDYLWTGTAYREFELWRENYPGGLSQNEEAYVRAMASHAKRRKRQGRLAVTVAFIVLLAGFAVVAGFWRRAVAEGLRAEASNLYTQAQMLIDEHPTGALAYATAALERADSREVREFVLDALWRGPIELRIPERSMYGIDFSPDGDWLVTASGSAGSCFIWPANGAPPVTPQFDEAVQASLTGDRKGILTNPRISPSGDLMAALMGEGHGHRALVLWTFPEGRWLRTLQISEGGCFWFEFSPDSEQIVYYNETGPPGDPELAIWTWPILGGEPALVARPEVDYAEGYIELSSGIDPSGQRLAWVQGNSVHAAPFDGRRLDESSVLTIDHPARALTQWFDNQGERLATADVEGRVRIWSLAGGEPELRRTLERRLLFRAEFSPTGSYFAGNGALFDLVAPRGARPLRLKNGLTPGWTWSAFSPDGSWLATTYREGVSFWSLGRSYPVVLPGIVSFSPDGRYIFSTAVPGRGLRVSPLDPRSGEGERRLFSGDLAASFEGLSEDGSVLAYRGGQGRVFVLSMDGDGVPRELWRFADHIGSLAAGPRGRVVAAGSGQNVPEEAVIRLWDMETGAERVIDDGFGGAVRFLRFTSNGDLVTFRSLFTATDDAEFFTGRLERWKLSEEVPRLLWQVELSGDRDYGEVSDMSPNERTFLFKGHKGFWLYDQESDSFREVHNHHNPMLMQSRQGGAARQIVFGPSGEVVVSRDADGIIRVGRLDDREPHLLIGESRDIRWIEVSPDGQWIAAVGKEESVLWPMPDLSEPPLHTLPHDELLARLRSLTNLRAVPDPESASGWKLEVGPFPGWEKVPTW